MRLVSRKVKEPLPGGTTVLNGNPDRRSFPKTDRGRQLLDFLSDDGRRPLESRLFRPVA